MQVTNDKPVGIERNAKAAPLFPGGHLVPFVLVTFLFFLWGIPNNLTDVLIRQFMKSFAISRFQAALVQSAPFTGYFVMAMPAAFFMRKFGYKYGFVAGLWLFGLGTFLFWPAAVVAQYGFFLVALFIIGCGLSFLETASNPFIAQLGDPASSERRLNFSQAFNPIGSITGVLIGTVFIFSGIELNSEQINVMKAQHLYNAYMRSETLRVVKPYLALGTLAVLWAILILRTKFPPIQSEHEEGGDHGHFSELFRYPHFWMAVVAQFLYVGAQVGTWSYFIQYVQEFTHEPEKTAGYLLTGTLVAFGVGRFSTAYLMRFIAPYKLLGVYAVVNVALVAFGVLHPGWAGLWSILLTSFFMSLMFPTIFALGLKGLGPNTKIGGSLIVMAIVGGALVPPLMGKIADARHSMAPAYVVPLIAYVVIAAYAFAGARFRGTGGAVANPVSS